MHQRDILIPLASSQQNLYDIYLSLCVQCQTPDDGQRNCPKHAEFYSKNKFEKFVHLIGFIIRIYHYERSSECQIHSRTVLILSFYTSLVLPGDAFPMSHMYYISVNHIFFDLIILIVSCKKQCLERSSLYIFLQTHVTSNFPDPNILYSTLFSNTINLCASFNIKHEVSHPAKQEDNILNGMVTRIPQNLICSLSLYESNVNLFRLFPIPQHIKEFIHYLYVTIFHYLYVTILS